MLLDFRIIHQNFLNVIVIKKINGLCMERLFGKAWWTQDLWMKLLVEKVIYFGYGRPYNLIKAGGHKICG